MTQASHHHDRNDTEAATDQAAPTSVEPVAPQDPHAQGAATGKQQQALQSNVSGSSHQGAAEVAHSHHRTVPGGTAGVHATGSETGTTPGADRR